jgi:MoaD family protein
MKDDMAECNSIKVSVRFFAAPREAIGKSMIELNLAEGSTVEELIAELVRLYPSLAPHTRFVSTAVNRSYVGMQTRLSDGDEVACLPPVGGG